MQKYYRINVKTFDRIRTKNKGYNRKDRYGPQKILCMEMVLAQLSLKDLREEVLDVMMAAPPNVSSSSFSYMFMGTP